MPLLRPDPRLTRVLVRLATIALCLAHAWAIWTAMGGRAGLTSAWPMAKHDHPLYYHYALATREFLGANGTTAGYDPSFMAGHAKSAVFPASSTLPELALFAFAGTGLRPEAVYKAYVLIASSLCPWLVWLATAIGLGRRKPAAQGVAVGLFLLYLWTAFLISYAGLGMVPYLLSIPLALAATSAICRYLKVGGWRWWSAASLLATLSFLVHLTTAMIVPVAAGASYLVAWRFRTASRPDGGSSDGEGEDPSWSGWRHLGFWAIAVAVLAVNAFWWLPGWALRSTKGPSAFAFYHSDESVLWRLAKIALIDAPILSVLCGLGAMGLAALARRDRIEAAGLGGFLAAGLFWGYLAGWFKALDFLQPGRHTYAMYAAAAALGGLAWVEGMEALRAWKLSGWARIAAILLGVRIFWPSLDAQIQTHVTSPQPFLTSQPPPHLAWIVSRVKAHVKPGERLLYEEGGFTISEGEGASSRDIPDPFDGGRYSGLLPHSVPGIELIGGPYLHAALQTNFTQFGENQLFDQLDWGRDRFVRYARLYRPAAIVCWSPHARAFCRDQANADLIDVLDDNGIIMIGRVKGFGGFTIDGPAGVEVEAKPGRLTVRLPAASPESGSGSVDNLVVLRYHYAPTLRAVSSDHANPNADAILVPVHLEDDPVPFIGLKQGPAPLTVELALAP